MSAPLITIVSGGAVAITAIVSKCGTGCISEECGWLLGWSIQQNAVPQCRNNHRNAINATNIVNRPATVPAKILVPNVVLKRSPFPSDLKITIFNQFIKNTNIFKYNTINCNNWMTTILILTAFVWTIEFSILEKVFVYTCS